MLLANVSSSVFKDCPTKTFVMIGDLTWPSRNARELVIA